MVFAPIDPGQTHPKVLAEQCEAYRLMLYARIRAFGLAGLVTFERGYLEQIPSSG